MAWNRWLAWTGVALVMAGIIVPKLIRAAGLDHVVISEIKIGVSGKSTDEFVELYNPTGNDINLENWKLTKKTKSGTESDLVSTLSGIIRTFSYFLITHTDSSASEQADMKYSTNSISDDNTLVLYNNSGQNIDMVGMGEATIAETTPARNPPSGKSLQRKWVNDEIQDTGNNLEDFVTGTPSPRNSDYLPNENTPTPTQIDPTPTNTLIPTNTPTPEPEEPTPTNTPTPEETIEPTATNTPIPEVATPTPTTHGDQWKWTCETKQFRIYILRRMIELPIKLCRFSLLHK